MTATAIDIRAKNRVRELNRLSKAELLRRVREGRSIGVAARTKADLVDALLKKEGLA